MRNLVRIFLGIAALGVCACAIAQAQAPAYPSKPVRWISPYAAGGAVDLTTRLVAQRMSELMGQPSVVDKRIGASGNIGGELAARAPADGYTLITITASQPAVHAVAERVPYDLTRDFAYVFQMTTQPYVLVVHPSIPAATIKELVAVARHAPRTLNYGSSGIATLQHLAGVMLGSMSGTELVHVPYMHAELVRALKSPEVEERLRRDGSEPVGNAPDELAAIVRGDLQRWRKHVKEAGIKAES